MTRPATGPPGYALLTAATVCRLADTAPPAVVLLVIARTGDPRLAGLLVAAFTVPTLAAAALRPARPRDQDQDYPERDGVPPQARRCSLQ